MPPHAVVVRIRKGVCKMHGGASLQISTSGGVEQQSDNGGPELFDPETSL